MKTLEVIIVSVKPGSEVHTLLCGWYRFSLKETQNTPLSHIRTQQPLDDTLSIYLGSHHRYRRLNREFRRLWFPLSTLGPFLLALCRAPYYELCPGRFPISVAVSISKSQYCSFVSSPPLPRPLSLSLPKRRGKRALCFVILHYHHHHIDINSVA